MGSFSIVDFIEIVPALLVSGTIGVVKRYLLRKRYQNMTNIYFHLLEFEFHAKPDPLWPYLQSNICIPTYVQCSLSKLQKNDNHSELRCIPHEHQELLLLGNFVHISEQTKRW